MTTTIDDLTGLLALRSFMRELEAAIKTNEPLVVIVLDPDNLRSVNEKYGHLGGDEWLKTIAGMFRETFACDGCLVARYGGDEFMAAVPASDPSSVFQQADALRQRVEKEKPAITVNGEAVRPGHTITLGMAVFPTNASTMDDLLEKGREAMRWGKIAGGNQVCFYQDTDFLTGLLSPSAIRQALEDALVRARAASDSVSVFALDVDRFKEINDEYGHRAGDEVLRRIGQILLRNFKGGLGAPATAGEPNIGEGEASGIAGRLGGDEFVVIFPGQRADSVFILAEEIRRMVEDSELPLSLGVPGYDERTYNLRMHISGGIATSPGDASEAVDLLRKADEALVRSKRTGRNRISLPASAQMITKTSYYSQTQLERLAELARRLDKTEAFLLREALDELLRKYEK